MQAAHWRLKWLVGTVLTVGAFSLFLALASYRGGRTVPNDEATVAVVDGPSAPGVVPGAQTTPRRTGTNRSQEAQGTQGSAIMSGVPPGLLREVLKIEADVAADPSATEKALPTEPQIAELIGSLGKTHEFVTVEGGEVRRSDWASGQLRTMGYSALPALLSAVRTPLPAVRQRALSVIFMISEDIGNQGKYIPVYALSLWDKDPKVRGTAAAQLGNVGIQLQGQLQMTAGYIHRTFREDPDKGVSYIAGEFLYRMGREDLLSEEALAQYRKEQY